jgi:hypothetical protein
VSNVSEALGVCFTDMDKIEDAATDCGAPAIATTKAIERKKIFSFIFR